MSALESSHRSEAVAEAAERRWAWIVGAIVAVLETHQQPDGSVRVPQALRKWLGREVLAPVTA